METIECSKCGAIFEKTGAKDKLRRFKDKRFMTTFHCPNCDARVILKNGDEPISIYLKRLERLKEQARRLGDRQEVNELQDEIDQISKEMKMDAGKTKDKKFSMKDHGYVVNRIGSYEIIEGAGVDGGWWYAKERKGRPPLETKKFKTRREAEEHARMSTDDAAYDPTKPKNIAKAKALSVAQGKAASDEEAYDPLDPENILKEKELAKARGAAAADVKDALFKGQKVTAIKSEQGLREGEVYTVLGEEAIIKQIVGENDTTVYKLQDSSGNVIVIESPEGLFYEVLDAYDDGYEAAKNGKPISDNPFKDRSRSGWGDFKESWDDGWRNGNKNKDSKTKDKITTHEYKGYTLEWDNENNKIPAKIISPSGKVIFTYAIGAEPTITGFNSKVNADLSKTKDKEEENESLKVKIGEIKKNMDAARKMGYDTEPYQKEIDKLETKDDSRSEQAYDEGYKAGKEGKGINANPYSDVSKSGYADLHDSWQDGWKSGKLDSKATDSKTKDDKLETKDEWTEEEIKKRMKRISEEIDKIVLSGGVVGLGDPLSIEYGRLKSKLKNKTKDDNSKNGYYAAMTGKARTDNPFTKGTPEYTKWDSDWKIGSEDFKYESNKELFKPKDSDDKELKEMLVNDAPDYYGAIVATARRGNNPRMGGAELRKNIEPFMTAHGVQFNEEEFNKAYKEFSKAGVSKAAFMKGTDAADVYTKDPLTKKGEKILAAMKKIYGEEKGEQIFYAARNKGKISGVDSKTKDTDRIEFNKLNDLIKEGRVEVDSWVGVRGSHGIAQVRGTTGKLSSLFVENIPNWFKQKYNIGDSKSKDDNLPADYLDKLEKEIRDIIKANGDKEKAKRLLHELENTGANKFPDLHKALDADYKIKECPNCKNQLTYAGEDNGKTKYKCELCGKSFVSKDSKTKDQEIKIIIGDDPVNPSPAEQKVEGNDVIYKEYTLKQLPETGEFEVYAPGGSIVGHAKALELAKLFVDRIVASRVGDEWSEEARKKL